MAGTKKVRAHYQGSRIHVYVPYATGSLWGSLATLACHSLTHRRDPKMYVNWSNGGNLHSLLSSIDFVAVNIVLAFYRLCANIMNVRGLDTVIVSWTMHHAAVIFAFGGSRDAYGCMGKW